MDKTDERLSWPNDIDVLIVHGLPGRPPPDGVSEDVFVYPETIGDVAKVLRETGLSVGFDHPRQRRAEVGFKAAEWWIPIVIFAKEVIASGAGELFADALRGLLGSSSKKSVLHLKAGVRGADGRVEWFESHGSSDDVIEAFREHHRAHE